MAESACRKIAAGLQDALLATRLAGEIIDLLPPGVATRDLFHQVIAIISPHVSAGNVAPAAPEKEPGR